MSLVLGSMKCEFSSFVRSHAYYGSCGSGNAALYRNYARASQILHRLPFAYRQYFLREDWRCCVKRIISRLFIVSRQENRRLFAPRPHCSSYQTRPNAYPPSPRGKDDLCVVRSSLIPDLAANLFRHGVRQPPPSDTICVSPIYTPPSTMEDPLEHTILPIPSDPSDGPSLLSLQLLSLGSRRLQYCHPTPSLSTISESFLLTVRSNIYVKMRSRSSNTAHFVFSLR